MQNIEVGKMWPFLVKSEFKGLLNFVVYMYLLLKYTVFLADL